MHEDNEPTELKVEGSPFACGVLLFFFTLWLLICCGGVAWILQPRH